MSSLFLRRRIDVIMLAAVKIYALPHHAINPFPLPDLGPDGQDKRSDDDEQNGAENPKGAGRTKESDYQAAVSPAVDIADKDQARNHRCKGGIQSENQAISSHSGERM
ncbi:MULTISPECIES: hypothetical protein [unclassified Rhizobium]|uniref:hypothetical protein n=1 Tax=unclassified Rhizobium TaxID=2613769 RepID=UPI001047A18A|nr:MULTISPECIES: hypothetical protein [unclassified Rhizobium]MBB3395946.1 hypothetical protein [Rhizobium sp. BK060]